MGRRKEENGGDRGKEVGRRKEEDGGDRGKEVGRRKEEDGGDRGKEVRRRLGEGRGVRWPDEGREEGGFKGRSRGGREEREAAGRSKAEGGQKPLPTVETAPLVAVPSQETTETPSELSCLYLPPTEKSQYLLVENIHELCSDQEILDLFEEHGVIESYHYHVFAAAALVFATVFEAVAAQGLNLNRRVHGNKLMIRFIKEIPPVGLETAKLKSKRAILKCDHESASQPTEGATGSCTEDSESRADDNKWMTMRQKGSATHRKVDRSTQSDRANQAERHLLEEAERCELSGRENNSEERMGRCHQPDWEIRQGIVEAKKEPSASVLFDLKPAEKPGPLQGASHGGRPGLQSSARDENGKGHKQDGFVRKEEKGKAIVAEGMERNPKAQNSSQTSVSADSDEGNCLTYNRDAAEMAKQDESMPSANGDSASLRLSRCSGQVVAQEGGHVKRPSNLDKHGLVSHFGKSRCEKAAAAGSQTSAINSLPPGAVQFPVMDHVLPPGVGSTMSLAVGTALPLCLASALPPVVPLALGTLAPLLGPVVAPASPLLSLSVPLATSGVASFSSPLSTSSAAGKAILRHRFEFGLVVACSDSTWDACKTWKQFSLPSKDLLNVPNIKPHNCLLFMYNIHSRRLHGAFQSLAKGLDISSELQQVPAVGGGTIMQQFSVPRVREKIGFGVKELYPISLGQSQLASVFTHGEIDAQDLPLELSYEE
ncbi:hypothetical protein CBR_g2731 [Chara braunii]|uniref:DCD domain-containing protein n=1 Tax=Chara braunii TaxID=69332 RepID=A0A388KDN6_CHABU|nr:hypothetical protein CBR_g2731 [Chara braunii]|eukprot:GBG68178.1 hypothetical protein CBR_g2731 [Chara braunii]